MPAQLDHIIRAASLARIARNMFRELRRVEIMLLVAAASGRKGVAAEHRVPEERAQRLAPGISFQLVAACFRQHLGNKRVGVLGTQLIAPFFQGVDDLVVIKKASKPTVTLVAGEGI